MRIGFKTFQLPRVAFTQNGETQTRNIFTCEECGYERNADVNSIDDAINLQGHFNSQKSIINQRYWKWPSRAYLVARKINRLTKVRGRALDIGCNTGINLKALGAGWSCYGVELSEPLADIASKLVPAVVYDVPFEDLPEGDKDLYELISAHALIEHIYDPVEFAKKAYRMLKINGMLVIMTGDLESKVAKKMGNNWPLYISKDHVSFFTARSVQILLKKSGFKIVSEEWRHTYFADGTDSWLRKILVKIFEIFCISPKAYFDNYYIYAKKIE